MKTLYNNTGRIAAAIVGVMVLSVGTAVAVTKNGHQGANAVAMQSSVQEMETIGRFVVTPTKAEFEAKTTETVGRFVVSPDKVVFVPGVSSDATA